MFLVRIHCNDAQTSQLLFEFLKVLTEKHNKVFIEHIVWMLHSSFWKHMLNSEYTNLEYDDSRCSFSASIPVQRNFIIAAVGSKSCGHLTSGSHLLHTLILGGHCIFVNQPKSWKSITIDYRPDLVNPHNVEPFHTSIHCAPVLLRNYWLQMYILRGCP